MPPQERVKMSNSQNGRDPFRELLEQLSNDSKDVPVATDSDDGNNGSSVLEEERPQGNRRGMVSLLLVGMLLFLSSRILGYITDWLWFDSLNLTSVYITRIVASSVTFLVSTLIFWLLLAGNIALATRLNARSGTSSLDTMAQSTLGLRVTPLLYVGAAVLAIMSGLAMMSQWEEILLFLNQTAFGLQDPIFDLDISFFIFSLPIWQGLRSFLLTALVFSLIGTMLISGFDWRKWFEVRALKAHMSLLVIGILLLIAWQYRLQSFDLVYSTRGSVFGAGFTDVNAQLPIFNVLAIVTLIITLLVFINMFVRLAWRVIVYALGVWMAVAIVAGNLVPTLFQRFVVAPNEYSREASYIQHNIDFTRQAYDLADLDSVAYNAREDLGTDTLFTQVDTITNIRLWDYRPMRETYNQIQALRQYYEFRDIDIDRYEVDGNLKQVLLSARELVPEQLSEAARTWVNQRLVYTHGYGVAMSPVSEITFDGLPTFLLKDLPPKGSILLEQPQLYFSEASYGYVVGNTRTKEFDYGTDDGNVFTQFQGDTGIRIGNLLTRLAFTIRFADINLLLTGDITPDSQLLWRRNIYERLREVAPFLLYDQDPYIVISEDGRLYWFVDAYTTSQRFPYSQPLTVNRSLNYIRNSVKIVINAYDGSVDFYLVDQDDPIAYAYSRIFPQLFTDFAEMPADLRMHIRYPQDLFTAQARILTVYHMTDTKEFYNREDEWQWPEEFFDDKAREMEPYYVLMQLPGSDKLDFVQILPFTPATRENMIAWLAAKSDPASYGEKVLYTFGKDSLIYGPKQIEARIDQDPIISSQLSLWNQQGSQVIRGNLLVIPLGNSLLYVEPLYLQAATGRIPELKRVIIAVNDRVVMAPNLGLALVEVFGSGLLEDEALASLMGDPRTIADSISTTSTDSGTGTTESVPAAPAPLPQGMNVNQLILEANTTYQQALEAQKAGNWATYGEHVAQLEAILAELTRLIGEPTQ